MVPRTFLQRTLSISHTKRASPSCLRLHVRQSPKVWRQLAEGLRATQRVRRWRCRCSNRANDLEQYSQVNDLRCGATLFFLTLPGDVRSGSIADCPEMGQL